MIYDFMSTVPPRGSIIEMIMMMVQMRREAAELLQTHLLVEATRSVDPEIDNDEAVQKALENYIFARSPHLEADVKREDKKMLDEMRAWTKAGPLAVQAAQSPMDMVRSQLKEKQHDPVPKVWEPPKRRSKSRRG